MGGFVISIKFMKTFLLLKYVLRETLKKAKHKNLVLENKWLKSRVTQN